MPSEETYVDHKEQLKQQQSSMTREEVAELMKKRSEYQLDLDNLPAQQHVWVDRGQKLSCEGAAHASHWVMKRR